MNIRAQFPRSEEYYKRKADYVEVLPKESRFSMIVIVPRKNYNVWQVVTKMRYRHFFFIMREYVKWNNVTLRLPKFKIDKVPVFDFTPVMKLDEVNLGSLVDKGNSSLTCMTPNPVYVESVKQNTVMKLDEKGMESGAIINFLVDNKTKKRLLKRRADVLTPPPPPADSKLKECHIVVAKPNKPKTPVIIPFLPGPDSVQSKPEGSPNSEISKDKEKSTQKAPEFEINANRPFIIAIIDRHASIPLMFARISKPLTED